MSHTSDPNNIQITQGESQTRRLTVRDADGNLVDLTGCVVYLTVKAKEGDTVALISKVSTTPSQILILTPQTLDNKGKADIFFTPTDTLTMTPKDYRFDTWVVLASLQRKVVIRPSPFTVQPTVTVIP